MADPGNGGPEPISNGLWTQVVVYCAFVPTIAFFAKVSDPVIGGTYMTLLNTVTNLGTSVVQFNLEW